MKTKLNKWLFSLLLLVFISILSSIPASKNPYETSINKISQKMNIKADETQLVTGDFRRILLIEFVELELDIVIDKQRKIVKAKLIKYPFQKEYKIRSLSNKLKN